MSIAEGNKKKSPWLKRILLAGLLLLLGGAATVWYVFNLKFADTKTVKADYAVSAMAFLNEFKPTDSTTKKRYKDKIVEISGRVSDAEAASDSSINIKMTDTLSGNYIIFSFQAQHSGEAKNLKTGDSVSIKGAFSDAVYSDLLEVMRVNIDRCTLTK